ncbi:MAG: zinc-dependent metalloprotease [Actinomycetota bacterium]|nr:zinc-dependent metalloprotease [Actinomycetota bacterium]
MAERPDDNAAAADPDEPTSGADRDAGDAATEPQEAPSADAWSDAVDRPRMGFSGSSPERHPAPLDGPTGGEAYHDDDADDGSDEDDEERGDFGEVGAMLQQLLGGGSGGMPDLGDLVRQLGGAGQQLPDLGELMRQFGGEGGLGGAGEAIQRMWQQMGVDPNDSGVMAMLQNQFQQLFTAQTPQSRMTMSTDVARKAVASQSDPTVTGAQQREVDEAVRVANLWIDPVTTLGTPSGAGVAWSRAEWVEATMPTWHRLVEPVADGVTAAMTSALDEQLGRLKAEGLGESLPELPGIDLGALIGQFQPALRQLAGSMFSAQLGHGVGALAADLLSATEVGLPLLPSEHLEDVALLPTNITEFTEGLGIDAAEVRLYLAVREAARTRLFTQVPWLGAQLEAAVRDYARNITIDTDAIEEQVRSLDLEHPAAIQEALQHKLFSPTPTPQQQDALGRLETSLALVEGWVDRVTEQATTDHLPHADALGEAVRRRRVGGPAQKTFSGLVGLELRPRRLKDAANLWAALENAGGTQFRDAPWEHPDLAPTGTDLDDPLGYVEKRRDAASSDDVDSALDELLRSDGPPPGPQDDDTPA